MRVKDHMARPLRVATPGMSLREAAALIDDAEGGVLPVCEGDQLVGMLTERDLERRSGGLQTPVRTAMTPAVHFCHEDDDLAVARRYLRRLKLPRIAVLSREDKFVGLLAAADDAPSVHAPSATRAAH